MCTQFEPNEIPPSLKPFFQEYDLAMLDPDRSAATIIERILIFGNRLELDWLFRVYSREKIMTWVQKWGKDGLPEPHLTFWNLVLGIEKDLDDDE